MERGRRGLLPLLALHAVNEYCRLQWKPPFTAGLVAANTLIYLKPAFLHAILPSVREVCFNPHLILKHRDLKRFLLSAFYHVDESHLVYNMISLLWKGIRLETSMGSAEFASMVVALLVMSQGITLLLANSLLLLDFEKPYYFEYAVGFSGVLLAMKVVLNSQSENYTYVHGLIVPACYAAWAELILIQMFVPGVSFLGLLGGILAGILYLRLKATYSGSPTPFSTTIRSLAGILTWPVRFLWKLFPFRQRGWGTGRGNQVGRMISGTWRCQACPYNNSDRLQICEMCGTSRSTNNEFSIHQVSHQSNDLNLEELRRR